MALEVEGWENEVCKCVRKLVGKLQEWLFIIIIIIIVIIIIIINYTIVVANKLNYHVHYKK